MRFWLSQPGIETIAMNAQGSRQYDDTILVEPRLYERVLFFDSLTKYTAASFRISRSYLGHPTKLSFESSRLRSLLRLCHLFCSGSMTPETPFLAGAITDGDPLTYIQAGLNKSRLIELSLYRWDTDNTPAAQTKGATQYGIQHRYVAQDQDDDCRYSLETGTLVQSFSAQGAPFFPVSVRLRVNARHFLFHATCSVRIA